MSVPLFADTWYGRFPPDEVRKELQNVYLLLQELTAALEALTTRVEALEP